MEINVYSQRNRFIGVGVNALKKTLWKDYQNKDNISLDSLQLDHVIPYCLSLDSSLSNLQLLTRKEHKKKTIIDHKIIKSFRNRGLIEKITNYWLIIKIPLEDIKREYLQALRVLQLSGYS